MQQKPYQLEKFAEGRYDVYAENGMRAGSIIGGNDQYAAEVGNRTVGRFTKKSVAAEAILEHAGITGLFDQMRSIAGQSTIVTDVHRTQLMDFDRADVEAWKCATGSLWVIHRCGTSLIHLDLPLSRRQAMAVLDAFTPGPDDSRWELYHIDVNDLKVKPLTEAQARSLASQSPLYQLVDDEVRFATTPIANITMANAAGGAGGKCKLTVQCRVEPTERRQIVLREIARQYFAANNKEKYTGIAAIGLRVGRRSVHGQRRPERPHH